MKLKPTEQKGEIGKSTTIVGDFNTFFLSTIDRTTRQKISKTVKEVNTTTSQQDLIDINGVPPGSKIYTLFKFVSNQ